MISTELFYHPGGKRKPRTEMIFDSLECAVMLKNPLQGLLDEFTSHIHVAREVLQRGILLAGLG